MAAGEYGSLCGAAHKPRRPDHPAYGITASGAPVEEGVTCAVDPEVIPLGSQVHVLYADGTVGTFRATDTGVKGEWVDIYTPDYDYAVQCGLQTLTVYWTVPEEETCDGQNKADFIQHRNGPRYPERHQDGNAAGGEAATVTTVLSRG